MKIILKLFLASCLSGSTWAGNYKDHTVELDAFSSKMDVDERKIREHVGFMKTSKDKKQIQFASQQIVALHREIQKTIKKANKVKQHLSFEHPEKGREVSEKYKRLNRESLKNLENELGLEKIMSEVYNKVKEKYTDSDPEEKIEKNQSQKNE